MNITKNWTLEFWKDGRIERYHTFEATPEQALKTQETYQRITTGRVLLALNQPEAVAV
jgi:hypothetical protein